MYKVGDVISLTVTPEHLAMADEARGSGFNRTNTCLLAQPVLAIPGVTSVTVIGDLWFVLAGTEYVCEPGKGALNLIEGYDYNRIDERMLPLTVEITVVEIHKEI